VLLVWFGTMICVLVRFTCDWEVDGWVEQCLLDQKSMGAVFIYMLFGS
jgi:hypothetical protein